MHAQGFFKEVAAIAQSIDLEAIETLARELAALRERGGRLFLLGVGGSAGELQPRGQRLPQAVRHRGLRADRQRLGADRAHQRRRLGHGVRRVAANAAAPTTRTRCSCFSVGGGDLEKNVSANIVGGARGSQGARPEGLRRRRARRRLHQAGRRLRRRRADGGRLARHAAHRGVSGGRLALPRVASGAAAGRDEVVSGRSALRRAVFLDRDGVINRAVVRDGKPYPPRRSTSFEILPGVPRGARSGCATPGSSIVVVTNQPDVAAGRQRREVVEAMHARLCARRCRSTRSRSAITPTPTAARAASRSPGCCSRRRASWRHRSRRELHGRRPLARRRRRPGGGVLHEFFIDCGYAERSARRALRRGRIARRKPADAFCRQL